MGKIAAFPAQRSVDNRFDENLATVSPVESLKYAQDVSSRVYVQLIASDAVEVGSTSTVIMATGHSAIRGDILRFTSGPFADREAVVEQVGAATITLADELPSAPDTGNAFDITRYCRPRVNSSGEVVVSSSATPNVLLVYDTVAAVADTTLTTVASYTAPSATTVAVISAGGEVYAVYTLVLNTVDIMTWRTGPDRSFCKDIKLSLATSDILDIKVEHFFPGRTFDFEASMFGF